MCDVIPFLFIAAIKASHDLGEWLRKRGLRIRPIAAERAAFGGMFVASTLMIVIFNPFTYIPRDPYGPIYGWESGASLDGLHAAESLIPPDGCLTASNNITTHYAMRTDLYVIGIGNYTACDRVLVDMVDRRYPSFGSPQEYACKIFRTQNFQPTFYQDNVVILRKDAPLDPTLNSQFAASCAAIVPES